MLTASALAVARSSDLPPGHHGGPLHPLAGLYAVTRLVGRLEGEQRLFPSCNTSLCRTNTSITRRWARTACWNSSRWIAAASRRPRKRSSQPSSGARPTRRIIVFCGSGNTFPPVEALDLLLTVAIPKNAMDDHYFIFPAFTYRALELTDPDLLPVLMRPAVRYVSRFPVARAIPDIDALIDQHELLTRVTRQQTGDDETATIGRLGEAIGRVRQLQRYPRADGRSPGGLDYPWTARAKRCRSVRQVCSCAP